LPMAFDDLMGLGHSDGLESMENVWQ
jgi:hypothetical protein